MDEDKTQMSLEMPPHPGGRGGGRQLLKCELESILDFYEQTIHHQVVEEWLSCFDFIWESALQTLKFLAPNWVLIYQ